MKFKNDLDRLFAEVEIAVENANEAYCESLEDVAAKVKKLVVDPVCREYNLEYVNGGAWGQFFIDKETRRIVHLWEIDPDLDELVYKFLATDTKPGFKILGDAT